MNYLIFKHENHGKTVSFLCECAGEAVKQTWMRGRKEGI
jgi:hypothetical protein